MAWVCCDEDKNEFILELKPTPNNGEWLRIPGTHYVSLPHGSIKKLIGRELKWEDEPVKLV